MTNDLNTFHGLVCHLYIFLLGAGSVEIFLLIFIDMFAFLLSGLKILSIF